MKRFLMIVLSSVIFSIPAMADDDKPISVNKMPQKAQEFIAKYFPGKNIAVAKQEGAFLGKNYDIIFINGDKLEFDRNGNWTNVDCKYTSVPEEIVPAPIAAYVKEHFPNIKIMKIEKEDKRYEVELSNDVDLKFNYSYQLLDIDL